MELKEITCQLVDSNIYPIGQEVYVPQRNGVRDTRIVGYEMRVWEKQGTLRGMISNYCLQHGIFLRKGAKSDLVTCVKDYDFYVEKSKAEAASKFSEVHADEVTWKLAVGDRDVKDEDSPYSIENCGLPACCGDISEARDILFYCKQQGGLLVHDQEELSGLITGHGFEYGRGSPMGKILGQLGIFVKGMTLTLDDIYKIVGNDLADKLVVVVGKEDIVEWFYEPNKALDGKSPRESHMKDPHKLERVLMDILMGAQGG